MRKTYGTDAEFKAFLEHLNSLPTDCTITDYRYPYAFTEAQSKQCKEWWKDGNGFRKIVGLV